MLRDGMTSPNAAVRMLACECLGALGHLPAAPLHRDDARRSESGGARRGRQRADAPGLRRRHPGASRKCLTDPEALVREAAVAAFCRMDVDAVAQTLLALVEIPAFPRRTALTIARANPHVAYLDYILACLSDSAPTVRRAAVEAVARQRTVDLVGILEPLLRDPDAEVRRSVVSILGGLRSRRVQAAPDHPGRDRRRDAGRRGAGAGQAERHHRGPVPDDESSSAKGPAAKLAVIEALKEIRDPAAETFLARQLGSPGSGAAAGGRAGAGRHAVAERDPAAGAGRARSRRGGPRRRRRRCSRASGQPARPTTRSRASPTTRAARSRRWPARPWKSSGSPRSALRAARARRL